MDILDLNLIVNQFLVIVNVLVHALPDYACLLEAAGGVSVVLCNSPLSESEPEMKDKTAYYNVVNSLIET